MTEKILLDKIRNIGFVAHIDAGKTTTTERVLFYTGRIRKLGEVDEGTTVMDWMAQERERGITITSAATSCVWEGYDINIIDTPGHVDFTVEVERALRVLDGCVGILDGVGGVEPQSETVWHQADRYKVPRMIFVNKMDRVGADFNMVIEHIKKRLYAVPLVLQIPCFRQDEFAGMIDIVQMKPYLWQDKEGKEYTVCGFQGEEEKEAKKYHEKLMEQLSETDDHFLDKFVHHREITIEEIKKIIRKATVSGKFFPVFCGSSLKNKGVQLLLNGIIDYLPSPEDVSKIKKSEHFSALAFKIQVDSYVGKLTYIRVYSGKISPGMSVYNSRTSKTERIMKILKMHANHREEIQETSTGDIVGLIGLKETRTGDTLCEKKHPVVLESIHIPEPVVWISIEPKTKKDQEKLSYALSRMREEDPTFRVKIDEETAQMIISGMGELHLEIIIDRMHREFGVEAHIGRPQVAYREAITKHVAVEGKYIKQSGGHGQYGHVELEIEPINEGFEFINEVKRGEIPREYIPAIEKGAKEAVESGPISGYPLINLRIRLISGSYHEVDSSDIAFKLATIQAVRDGTRKADAVLLEPIMKIEITVYEESLGDVLSDINARRGKVLSLESREIPLTDGGHLSDQSSDRHNRLHYVKGMVPLAEMFGYTTSLRSLTQGRATYTMELSHYDKVPRTVAEKLLPAVLV